MTLRASTHDGTHPRPTLMRQEWADLDGPWDFAHDDEGVGLAQRWYASGTAPAAPDPFTRTIEVPFVPESEASGIHETGYHPTVWYRRTITASAAPGTRLLLHLGAVDHEAHVWVDGRLAGHHVGGQTTVTCDLTDLLDEGEDHVIVVRAHDEPDDPELPRGKQDWREEPHGIWYHRSTGIWRSVWLETVPGQHVTGFHWDVDLARCRVDVSVTLALRPSPGTAVRIALAAGDEQLGTVELGALDRRVEGTVEIPAIRNTQDRDRLLWRPERPTLIDVTIQVLRDGEVVDTVASYLGLRSAGIDRGWFLLNGEPYFVRSVLEQGYWPTSHLTAPSLEAHRHEVELIKELGFTAARVHQKVADPRFLFWADRLGLLIWGETANAYAFSPRAAAAITGEWTEIIEQVRAHPSVVTWVPVNESWGVRDLADSAPQRELTIALTALTRALDPTRPVVSNDGYELTGGDVIALHDYTTDADTLRSRYADEGAVSAVLAGRGPQRRRPIDDGAQGLREDAPVMITEFGGIAYAAEGTWGYATVASPQEFEQKIRALFAALNASPALAGHCYTQLTDTLQEANGLATADRHPKLDPAVIRAVVTGNEH